MQTTTQIPFPAHARREAGASIASARLEAQAGPPESPAGATTSPDLRAALAGADPTVWAEVTTQYQTLISSRARRHCLTPDEAADVAQQTWLRLFENAERVRDPQRLAGWLATTANREAINVRQRAWREQPRPDTAIDESHEPDCDARLDAEYRAQALRAAVAELPTGQRRLVELLLEPEPPSYAEISARLGMPIGSIGPIRARALHRLRQRLQALEGGDTTPPTPRPSARTTGSPAAGVRDPRDGARSPATSPRTRRLTKTRRTRVLAYQSGSSGVCG